VKIVIGSNIETVQMVVYLYVLYEQSN